MNRRQVLIGAGAVGLAGAAAAGYGVFQMGSMDEYAASAAVARAALAARPEFIDFIRLATLAASGHNAQPWRFRVRTNEIEILPDLTRRTPVVDPDDHHLYVSLGCAAENLAVALAARGRSGDLRLNLTGTGSAVYDGGDAPQPRPDLLEAICQRQSTRTEYDGRSVSTGDLRLLAAAVGEPAVDLALITDRRQMEQVLELVIAGNSAQMAEATFLRELKSWMRYNPRQAMACGDGLFSAASGNPIVPSWLGSALFDLAFQAGAENEKYAKHVRSSAGLAVFVSQAADRENWMRAGRASQRFALQATALGLKHAFINQPVEVAQLRPQLAELIGLPGRRPDLVMRYGYGRPLPFSPRRSAKAVLA